METIQSAPVALLSLLLLVALPAGALGAAAHPGPASETAQGSSVDAVDAGTLQTEANATNASIADISYRGNATIAGMIGDQNPKRAYIWQSESYMVNVTYTASDDDAGPYQTCLRLVDAENSTSANVTCKTTSSAAGQHTVSFQNENWTAGPPGQYETRALLKQDNQTVTERNMTAFVLAKKGDFDGDQLPNRREQKIGTEINGTDTDNDGLEDGPEVFTYETDPLSNDTDDDGLNDGYEVSIDTDPTEADTDDDGLSDLFEDNHRSSPTEADTDDDNLGDEAEYNNSSNPLQPQSDNDGIPDGKEVKAFGTEPDATDSDGDFLDDDTELALGTNPTSVMSPFGWLLLALLAVGVAVGGAARRGWIDVPYVDGVKGRVNAVRTANPATAERTDGAGASRPLTDNERVEQIVEAHGGQVRQSEIVEETGWSKAKVSRVLSRMEDDGEIAKIRIGRENLICLPGHEPPSMQQ